MSLGKIEITQDVIVDIIEETIEKNEEIIEIAEKTRSMEPITVLKNIVKPSNDKFVDVELGDLECVIDIGVVAKFGVNLEKAVTKLQEEIKENVEKITGKRVTEINVTVKRLIKNEKKENGNV